ncbi:MULTISPECIES: winged helix-turn-helix domain-containing protein [unclassified Rhizobium]|uniref:winged helix-turn-helix domain-containing protein n=1 Tax=unclassified Rhizobium TaxID=2613769 RepID=UPI000EA9D0BA|nr:MULTISPECIES: winged helix-turn-helix domain-containing protein [unclassified Rhizobium]AYG69132.1 CadC family transcriptional regulator [Rhizobium sp. CCGE531]AYG75512.1 CadC family transcriptional regulator [Rhizobium sp. CCGE532]
MFFFAGFVLDPDRAELHGPDGSAIRLRPKAFELLRLLVANNRRIVGKQELMEAVWPGIYVAEDSLFQCVREIRTALGDTERHMIKLVSGRGYLFTAEVSTEQPGSAPLPVAIDTQASDAGPRYRPGSRKALAFGAFAILCAIVVVFSLTVFSFRIGDVFGSSRPIVEVLPIVDSIGDPQSNALAQAVAAEMINGLAKIDGIRLIASREQGPVKTAEAISGHAHGAGLLLQGELQRSPQSWIFQTRLINVGSREIESVAEITLDASEPDKQRLAARLAAGAGYELALRLNKFGQTDDERPTGAASVAIQQATASINQTTKERFATARAILEKYLSDQPNNADLQIALAALHLRGVQLAWYSPAEGKAAENEAGSLLEHALRTRPDSIPVLGVYCRFLTVTNQFSESLVACARALSLNPWDGTALFHLGLTQIQLGRFEDALATFEQADRFNTPEVSRWTWLLGAGWADIILNHNEDAIGWLQRSIAITPGTGRAHMLLAIAYQRLGRSDDAKQALAEGLQLRPGSTAANISLPTRNTSPTYLEARQKIIQTLIEIGLPAGDDEQKPDDKK